MVEDMGIMEDTTDIMEVTTEVDTEVDTEDGVDGVDMDFTFITKVGAGKFTRENTCYKSLHAILSDSHDTTGVYEFNTRGLKGSIQNQFPHFCIIYYNIPVFVLVQIMQAQVFFVS